MDTIGSVLDLQPSVAGRLISADGSDAIRIDADGGFWTSGWIRSADGGFDTQVRLVEGKLTQFWLYARRQDGALVDLNPNSFSIRHGLVPALPPLPHSIGIEIVKSGGKAELDWIYRKGESLPLKREVRFRAAHDLRQPDGSLAIKIWEGETQEDPEANSWSGALTISARQIAPLAIQQGTEICLTVAIDESRRITVDAFVPNLQRTFSDGIYLPERDQQTPDAQFEETVGAIEPLVERLAAVRRAASERDDSSASLAADRLADKLEEISMVDAAAGSDDPDSASRSMQDVKKIRIDLARLEQQTGVGERLTTDAEQVKRAAGPIREITEKYGADLDKRQLGMLIRDLDRADGRGDNRTVRRVAEDLQSLKWRVLFTQDWFWKEALEAQQQPGCKFLRRDEASKWLEKGCEAVRKGDSLSLQEAVKHLWELQPKSEVQLDKERAMQAGLRRF